jgi:hypothetical protein
LQISFSSFSKPRQDALQRGIVLVVLDQLECLGAGANFLGDPVQLIIEHIAEALGENEREDEVLKLWSVLRATNRTGDVPYLGFERFIIPVFHLVSWLGDRRGLCATTLDESEAVTDYTACCGNYNSPHCPHQNLGEIGPLLTKLVGLPPGFIVALETLRGSSTLSRLPADACLIVSLAKTRFEGNP